MRFSGISHRQHPPALGSGGLARAGPPLIENTVYQVEGYFTIMVQISRGSAKSYTFLKIFKGFAGYFLGNAMALVKLLERRRWTLFNLSAVWRI